MSRADDFKRMGEEYMTAYGERKAGIRQLFNETHQMMRHFASQKKPRMAEVRARHNEMREMLGEFHDEHAKMGQALRRELAGFNKNRIQEAHKDYQGRKKYVADVFAGTHRFMAHCGQENKARHRGMNAMLKRFHNDHMMMGAETRKGLASFNRNRLQQAKADYKARRTYVNHCFADTAKMMAGYAREQAQAKAAYQRYVSAPMYRAIYGKASPSEELRKMHQKPAMHAKRRHRKTRPPAKEEGVATQ